jgi:hypothetical protein
MVTKIKKGTSKEEIRNWMEAVISRYPKKNNLKYEGKLKTEIDPLEYPSEMRNEWA